MAYVHKCMPDLVYEYLLLCRLHNSFTTGFCDEASSADSSLEPVISGTLHREKEVNALMVEGMLADNGSCYII